MQGTLVMSEDVSIATERDEYGEYGEHIIIISIMRRYVLAA